MKVSQTAYWISAVVLLFYVFSIVYGRLYTGMHSFTDCAVGVLLGTAIWVLYVLYGDTLDFWLKNSGWIGGYCMRWDHRARLIDIINSTCCGNPVLLTTRESPPGTC